jgi:hypothetical protein
MGASAGDRLLEEVQRAADLLCWVTGEQDRGKLRRSSLVMGSGFLFLGLTFGILLPVRLIS